MLNTLFFPQNRALRKNTFMNTWRCAYICKVHYKNGDKRYILHPRGVMIGDTILSGPKAPISIGNALPLSAV